MVRVVPIMLAGVFGLALCAAPTQALADRGGHHSHGRDRHHHSRAWSLPRTSIKIVLGGRPFFYDRGAFYRRRVFDYVIVPAPVGAVVREVPTEAQTVVINGVTYLNYDGVYYKSGPAGYTVVSLPIANGYGTDPVTIASAPASTQPAGETITINVPNANGSYTPVKLQEVNGTYVGPRGEVYSTKPELSQLKSMYGQ